MQAFTRFKVNEPQVIQETIEGEAVIVNLSSGNYYSLDKLGADIWESVEKGNSVGEILQKVCTRYSGKAELMEGSVKQLIEELVKEDLIVPDESKKDAGADMADCGTVDADGKEEFESPVLKKYSDMQDLLLLDPIHEVDEAGWPNIKANPANKE